MLEYSDQIEEVQELLAVYLADGGGEGGWKWGSVKPNTWPQHNPEDVPPGVELLKVRSYACAQA